MKKLHICAGGKGTRFGYSLDDEKASFPKHLLPVPGKKSIVEKIINDGADFFDSFLVHASKTNRPFFDSLFYSQKSIPVRTDKLMTGPLGPIVRALKESGERQFGVAGDMVCEFSWSEFLSFHESHQCPVSILIAKSCTVPRGARFLREGKLITDWERVPHTVNGDFINMGGYIIDDSINQLLESLPRHKEDLFFDLMIKEGLLAGYTPTEEEGFLGFNLNNFSTYAEMCKYYSLK